MKKVGICIFLFFLAFLGSTSVLFAQNNTPLPFRQGEKITIDEDEVFDRDFFAAGEDINVKGTVNGDLYIAGGNIVVSGKINGDVLVAGGQVEISGDVAGNIRAVGGNIEVQGMVGKNLTAVGGNIEVTNSANIIGSTVVGAGNVELNGPVGGNVVGGVGNLIITNAVGGTIYTGVGQLQIGDGASVADVVYWSDEKATVSSEATVSGNLDQRIPVESSRQTNRETRKVAWTGFRFFSFLSMVVIGLLMLRFFPGLLETGAGFIDKKPWQSLGFGFLKLILEPIVAIILMVTIIGLPIGIFLVFAYIIELYFASYMVANWVGRLIWGKLSKNESRYWAFVLGALVFVIVTSVPVVGGIVRFFSLLFGLGAILLLKYAWYKKTFIKAK